MAGSTQITDNRIYEAILETSEFKRLQKIHQLGVYHKYQPNVNHNRYDHCKGVYERASQFLDVLEKNSKIRIHDFHKTCVKFAGLLHDIGHGPFSHFWNIVDKSYKHEHEGGKQVDQIFKNKNIRLSQDSSEHDYGVELIKRLITGDKTNFKLRFDQEEFIFDIINNKTCNIDVDRQDYLHRDWKEANKSGILDIPDVDSHLEKIDKLFEGARISPDRKCVLFKRKHIDNINCLFKLRESFHKFIYQIPEIKILEEILSNAIEKRWRENNNNINISRNALHDDDESIEKWLSETEDPETKVLVDAFNNFEKFVSHQEKFEPGFTKVEIPYNYELNERIKDCLYGGDTKKKIIMAYNFTYYTYYKINEST